MDKHICHRWGPGRLPLADRRDIGGGYAIAGMGLAVTIVWFAIGITASAVDFLGIEFTDGLSTWAPIVIPLAGVGTFVAAVVLWRRIPADDAAPSRGARYGVISGLAGLSVAPLGVAVYAFVETGPPLGGALAGMFVVYQAGLVVALISVGWLVLPALAFAGWYHEWAIYNRIESGSAS